VKEMVVKSSKPGAGFAWRFHYGLRTLKRAYESSRFTAAKEKKSIEATAAKFQSKVDKGVASWVQVSEVGYPEYDYGEQLGEMLHEEETVLNLVRLAFVISLHHYVEQQLISKLPLNKKGEPHYDQPAAFEWLKSYGWKPKEDDLNELRLAANCAKHSAGKSASDLHGLRPDMFDASKIKMGFEPGYDSLALTDQHVAAFFEAVKESVPDNLGISF
jgi:hypothetical protein